MFIGKFVRFLFTTTAIFLLSLAGLAQAKFTIQVSDMQPGLNDYVQVNYTIENAKTVEKFAVPTFKNFRVLQGPVTQNQTFDINGYSTNYQVITFVLQPIIKGKLKVPGATATIDGKTMRSSPVSIQVGNHGSARSLPNNAPSNPFAAWPSEPQATVDKEYVLKPGENPSDKIKNNLFVTSDVNKKSCYEGEPIVVTYKLCSRLKSESRVTKRPSLNGFSVYDMVEPDAVNDPFVEKINGRQFKVHVIRKAQLFPLQSGSFEIDPVELQNNIEFVKISGGKNDKNSLQQLMDELAQNGGAPSVESETHNITLASKPISITVKPLPENKPDGFNGAVGKFTIETSMPKQEVKTGEVIHLLLQVKGEGNFSVINAPELSLPASAEVYDTDVKETVDKTVYPLPGYKTFDYSFTLKDAGSYEIPAVNFSYFDPAAGKYKTLRTDSFSISVRAAVKKVDISSVASDSTIRAKRSGSIVEKFGLITIIAAPLLLLLAVLGLWSWFAQRKKNKAPVPQPIVAAEPEIIEKVDELAKAKLALHNSRSEQFYSEINLALWKSLQDKLKLQVTDLNKPNVLIKLATTNTDPEITSTLHSIWQDCELALYTPVHSETDMQQTLLKTQKVIDWLNSQRQS